MTCSATISKIIIPCRYEIENICLKKSSHLWVRSGLGHLTCPLFASSVSCFQMEKVEADLFRSKSLREKQTKEFGHQLEELQQKYEQQVSIGENSC